MLEKFAEHFTSSARPRIIWILPMALALVATLSFVRAGDREGSIPTSAESAPPTTRVFNLPNDRADIAAPRDSVPFTPSRDEHPVIAQVDRILVSIGIGVSGCTNLYAESQLSHDIGLTWTQLRFDDSPYLNGWESGFPERNCRL